jgi:heme exporter protein D
MNWSEFFSMGGYAFYVWGSYLLMALAMGGEVLFLMRRRKLPPRQINRPSTLEGKQK